MNFYKFYLKRNKRGKGRPLGFFLVFGIAIFLLCFGENIKEMLINYKFVFYDVMVGL